MTSYLLDANVFIQAKNQYYGFDIVPAFWDWLIAANGAGTVFSIEKVSDELVGYGNELAEWAKARNQVGGFFLPADQAVLEGLKDVARWASGQAFTESAVNEFLQAADYYLVAHALARAHCSHTGGLRTRDYAEDQDSQCMSSNGDTVGEYLHDAAD
jgi:Domain of unknown function (DUF4411)